MLSGRDNSSNEALDAALNRIREIAQDQGGPDSSSSIVQDLCDQDLPRRRLWFRPWIWARFEAGFRYPQRINNAEYGAPEISAMRRRASQLNQYYAGLYRGAFLLNYLLAVVAVALGATSLVLMGATHTDLSRVLATALQTNSSTIAPGSAFVLILVTLAKLGVVGFMMRNTNVANKEKWNEKAIHFRYLAEQLRCVPFLQMAGNGQGPRSSRSLFSSKAVRQGTVDWLVGALVRNFDRPPPAALDPAASLEVIKTQWIQAQIDYHEANTRMMSRIESFTERWSRRINRIVMAAVGIDLLTLTMNWLGWLPDALSMTIAPMSPALVFLAALLPAVVASLSGIRFQSECGRLAERSAVVTELLRDRVREAEQLQASIAMEMPSRRSERLADVLRLAENCARDLIDEVAEWSVLYQKELRTK